MKSSKILFFIFLVIALLTFVSFIFPEEGIEIGKHRLFFPTMEEIMIREKSQSAGEKMRALEESLRMQFYQDSVATAEKLAYEDSLQFYTRFFENHASRIYLPKNDYLFFDSFFQEIESAKNNNEIIHILHYGDSQIESDRITAFFRQKLQETFGGEGVGLIPIVQPIPTVSIGQTASENIQRFTVAGSHRNRANHRRYGILGQVGHIYGGGSVSVNSRDWKNTFENVKEFSKVRVFINNNSPEFSIALTPSQQDPIIKTIAEANSGMSVLTWNFPDPIRRFSLKISGTAEITGISLDGDSGLTVDNIPLRGSSGTFFSEIDSLSMASMMDELHVRLIILQFGGNMMPSLNGEKSIQAYKEKIGKQIAYFYQICPDAKILFVGPSDMSKKINGRLQTYPHLKATVDALKEVALENDAAFWDVFQVMGGENSMIEWVNNKPALATPDYIHFTNRGADRIAEILYESLMIYYDYYRFVNSSGKSEQVDEPITIAQ